MAETERVFVDIDTQFDFMDPAGKLYVPGAVEIQPALGRLFHFAVSHRILVLSSADDHPPDDPEFGRFPPHCVHGTAGQKKLSITTLDRSFAIGPDGTLTVPPGELARQYDQIIFLKRTFDVFSNRHFAEVVDALPARDYVVFGVATDYCVRAAAIGLLRRGRRVVVVRDAVRAVAPETGMEACRELSELGAEWILTDEILNRLGR